MDKDEARRRTKLAVANWCGEDPAEITLTDVLDSLRGDGRPLLRTRVNTQFQGETGFPIPAGTWNAKPLKTVDDVRDLVVKQLGI